VVSGFTRGRVWEFVLREICRRAEVTGFSDGGDGAGSTKRRLGLLR
jgi:hypothetical protein